MVCPICEADKGDLITVENNYRIRECYRCKVVYVENRPNFEELKEYYLKRYIPMKEEEWKSCMLPIFEHDVRNIERKVIKKGRILEIGSNYGLFLKLMKDRGWKVYGVEPLVKPPYKGLNIIKGFFEEIEFKERRFDAVSFWFVLEHMINPLKVIEKSYNILKDGGWIFIRVPNIYPLIIINKLRIFNYSLFKKILRKVRSHRIRDEKLLYILDPPLHLFGFSKESLKFLLKKVGFKNIKIKASLMPVHNFRLFLFYNLFYKGLDLIIDSFTEISIFPVIEGSAQK